MSIQIVLKWIVSRPRVTVGGSCWKPVLFRIQIATTHARRSWVSIHTLHAFQGIHLHQSVVIPFTFKRSSCDARWTYTMKRQGIPSRFNVYRVSTVRAYSKTRYYLHYFVKETKFVSQTKHGSWVTSLSRRCGWTGRPQMSKKWWGEVRWGEVRRFP